MDTIKNEFVKMPDIFSSYIFLTSVPFCVDFRMPDEIKKLSNRYPDIIQVCYLNKGSNDINSAENEDED